MNTVRRARRHGKQIMRSSSIPVARVTCHRDISHLRNPAAAILAQKKKGANLAEVCTFLEAEPWDVKGYSPPPPSAA